MSHWQNMNWTEERQIQFPNNFFFQGGSGLHKINLHHVRQREGGSHVLKLQNQSLCPGWHLPLLRVLRALVPNGGWQARSLTCLRCHGRKTTTLLSEPTTWEDSLFKRIRNIYNIYLIPGPQASFRIKTMWVVFSDQKQLNLKATAIG